MKALTISFSSDKTDCKKLFLAWFRHSRSNVIRISLLALIGFALLFGVPFISELSTSHRRSIFLYFSL